MNNKITSFMMFIFGAAVGSVVTWQYAKKKYEKIAQEEIDSVKEVFSKREAEFTDDTEARWHCLRNATKKELYAAYSAKVAADIEYADRLRKHGYTDYSDTDSLSEEEVDKNMINDKPYVISPDEFGEFYDYEKISLIYYADQVLADEDDELVEDIEETVGFESLNAFGEYEDDSVFVRNDRLKCDYEILLDQRKYSDVIKRRPHEVED